MQSPRSGDSQLKQADHAHTHTYIHTKVSHNNIWRKAAFFSTVYENNTGCG